MTIQWLRSLYSRQISSCLVWFLFGPGPVLCCFAVCFMAKRKSGWGICGSSLFVWLWFSLFVLIDLLISRTYVLVQCFSCLLSCKDRAISATSATLEETRGGLRTQKQNDSKQIWVIKGSLGGETSVLRTFRMSGKELVKERVSKERVRQGKS